jgi:hypothetical protein
MSALDLTLLEKLPLTGLSGSLLLNTSTVLLALRRFYICQAAPGVSAVVVMVAVRVR